MSSGLSGSCHTACVLAEEYRAKVWVADNHRISVTLMESVFDAKWLAGQGKTAKEIKACLEANAHRSSIYITVNSLSYLKKSGRITLAAAGLADILGIKPILTIQGEKLEPFAKARGVRQSERKTLPCSIACHVGVDAIGIGVSVFIMTQIIIISSIIRFCRFWLVPWTASNSTAISPRCSTARIFSFAFQ